MNTFYFGESFTDKFIKYFLIILIYINLTPITFSQVDSTIFEENDLLLIPSLHSIQIDATSIILMHQIGGQFDFDVLTTSNESVCIGTRVSVEHYYLNNFVEKVDGSPFTNYNLYARLSGKKDDFYINVLGGVTYYTTADPSYLPSKYLFRTGFEIKYGNTFGFILKGSTSLIKNSSFIGFGISLGYNHN